MSFRYFRRLNWRCLLLIPWVGILASSCALRSARTHFEVPEVPPLFQLFLDRDSDFERQWNHKGPMEVSMGSWTPTNDAREAGQTAQADSADQTESADAKDSLSIILSLMVPITEDGFCLTAAHNLGKGDAMDEFEPGAIRRRDSGDPYVMVDLRKESSPPFIQVGENFGQTVTAKRKGSDRSNRFYASDAEPRRLGVYPRVLNCSEFETLQNGLGHHDAAFWLRLREIKVWNADDLALVKVPFPTPSYFTVSESETPRGGKLMVFVNPGTHSGVINYVTRRIDRRRENSSDAFSEFYPLQMANNKNSQSGDSGGPVIDDSGELVGIYVARVERFGSRHTGGLAVGLRRGPIMEAVKEARRELE